MSIEPYQSVNPDQRLTWLGASGTRYEFYHYRIGYVTFHPVAGVYIFCHQRQDGLWYPIYVGETDNFRRLNWTPDLGPLGKV